jgi:hypothetical protein
MLFKKYISEIFREICLKYTLLMYFFSFLRFSRNFLQRFFLKFINQLFFRCSLKSISVKFFVEIVWSTLYWCTFSVFCDFLEIFSNDFFFKFINQLFFRCSLKSISVKFFVEIVWSTLYCRGSIHSSAPSMTMKEMS